MRGSKGQRLGRLQAPSGRLQQRPSPEAGQGAAFTVSSHINLRRRVAGTQGLYRKQNPWPEVLEGSMESGMDQARKTLHLFRFGHKILYPIQENRLGDRWNGRQRSPKGYDNPIGIEANQSRINGI